MTTPTRRGAARLLLALVLALAASAAAQVTDKLQLPLPNDETGRKALRTLDAIVGEPAACNQILSFSGNPTEAGATNDFCSVNDHACSTTEANEDDFVVPVDVQVQHLRCIAATAPGAGVDDWKISIRDDGATITPLCSIDETATTCTTTARSATISAGSKINAIIDSSGGGADPAANALIECTLCLRTTTPTPE